MRTPGPRRLKLQPLPHHKSTFIHLYGLPSVFIPEVQAPQVLPEHQRVDQMHAAHLLLAAHHKYLHRSTREAKRVGVIPHTSALVFYWGALLLRGLCQTGCGPCSFRWGHCERPWSRTGSDPVVLGDPFPPSPRLKTGLQNTACSRGEKNKTQTTTRCVGTVRDSPVAGAPGGPGRPCGPGGPGGPMCPEAPGWPFIPCTHTQKVTHMPLIQSTHIYTHIYR